MKKDYTHVTVVVDRSGSMAPTWSDVVGGYEKIVREQRDEPGECTLTTAVFDDQYELFEDFTDIKKAREKLDVIPRGMTALLDAIGKTINSVGERLANLKENERPEKCIFIVQTDGMENSSKEFTKEQIKKMIDEQSKKYSWEFMFLGASLDAVNEANDWGFDPNKSALYSIDNYDGTLNVLNEKMKKMRSAPDEATYAAAAAFSSEERSAIK